jgi:hypothetical protein
MSSFIIFSNGELCDVPKDTGHIRFADVSGLLAVSPVDFPSPPSAIPPPSIIAACSGWVEPTDFGRENGMPQHFSGRNPIEPAASHGWPLERIGQERIGQNRRGQRR